MIHISARKTEYDLHIVGRMEPFAAGWWRAAGVVATIAATARRGRDRRIGQGLPLRSTRAFRGTSASLGR